MRRMGIPLSNEALGAYVKMKRKDYGRTGKRNKSKRKDTTDIL